jgi:hypothetical protein
MSETAAAAAWLVLVFSLPAKSASQRVDVWRRLRRYGAIALPGAGHLLPRTPANEERLQWLATDIRKHKGEASIIRAEAIGDLPTPEIVKLFNRARAAEYDALGDEVKTLLGKRERESPRSQLARAHRRLQEIVERDFFASPARGRVEALLSRLEPRTAMKKAGKGKRRRADYEGRTWVTRPRPGIDRVGSAWLIRRFIDANARFTFADDPKASPGAVPFDMFTQDGFGHEGGACTFEALVKAFGITDRRVVKLAQAIHDADLEDEKFGRGEAIGIARVLAGWNEQGVSDDELLRRGIEMIEGIYQSL